MIQIPPDFKDLLDCFNSAFVRYLLVGGYAVNFHGHHRNTKDIDHDVEQLKPTSGVQKRSRRKRNSSGEQNEGS